MYKLYDNLCKKDLNVEERLDILLVLKDTIKINKDDLSAEIRLLINREADMIKRKRPIESLNGLRTRIGNLFLRFIENKENNPELQNHQLNFNT